MTYHTTGFDHEEIIDLCIRINSAERGTGASKWPPCLGLFKSVMATLTYMRHTNKDLLGRHDRAGRRDGPRGRLHRQFLYYPTRIGPRLPVLTSRLTFR